MTRRHEAYFTGLHVAQEARRAGEARADDSTFGQGGTRFAGVIDTDARVAPQLTFLPLRSYVFVLTMPVSVNAAWRSPQRKEILAGMEPSAKFLTDEHRQYRSNVISRVRAVMRTDPPLLGRVELRATLYFGNARVCDIDNRIKPLQDALTHAEAFRDDAQVDRLIVERIIGQGAERCVVELKEIAA